MAAARAPRRWATIRRRPGACRPSATAPARRASSPIVTSSAAGAAARRVAADEPFLQEGAVGRGAPDAARRVHERLQQQDDAPHLVADVDDLPRDGGPHHRRPRRPQARSRVRVGVDGRPQARRVRADAPLPRTRLQGQGAMTPANPQDPPKGKPDEDKVAEDAKDSKAAAKPAEPPEPKPKRTRAKKATPAAEGQAAEETGVDKDAAAATETKPAPKRRRVPAEAKNPEGTKPEGTTDKAAAAATEKDVKKAAAAQPRKRD